MIRIQRTVSIRKINCLENWIIVLFGESSPLIINNVYLLEKMPNICVIEINVVFFVGGTREKFVSFEDLWIVLTN